MQPYLRRRDVRRRDVQRARAAAVLSRLGAVLRRHRQLAQADPVESCAAKSG
jgi:hypothetical protein